MLWEFIQSPSSSTKELCRDWTGNMLHFQSLCTTSASFLLSSCHTVLNSDQGGDWERVMVHSTSCMTLFNSQGYTEGLNMIINGRGHRFKRLL